MNVEQLVSQIRPADKEAMRLARARWESLAKPLGSLGLLEESIVRIAGASGSADIDIARKALIVMCADNGVVEEGVTQTGQEVTAIVTRNMAKGASSVCCMARVAHADVVPVDMGVAFPVQEAGVLQRSLRRGSANLAKGPAMRREECEKAILTGAEIAASLVEEGYRLLAVGEMGIGNTTTAAAVSAALLRCHPEMVTGRGAGLSSAGLARKVEAIRRGLQVNAPDPADPIDVLHKVGGFDIAGMVGVFLGGALHRVPVLIDGFISSVAALIARRLCTHALGYMLASHVSGEPAGKMLLEALDLEPILYAGMRLGEGSGAVALMPLLDMALAVYRDMLTFQDAHIKAYERLR